MHAPTSAPARTDGLWRTTCFEAFIRPGAGEAYTELNFAPSTQWAAYRFDSYRSGMSNAIMRAPVITVAREGRSFTLTAQIDTSGLGLTPSARVGLSAVLEEKSGAKSYWALAHGGDKPDFHRAEGFIARLPFESRP
ncbi:MAG: DOMON-like domain-containing protein [Parvularculaceae bacterium]|nr:DOMON-like domain-containing protein [Parvularculaceae bacterium]